MRLLLPILFLAQLSACVEAESPAILHTRQEAACTAVIAAHIQRPASEVASRWLSEAGGVAQVEARDGSRRHICNLDSSARVLGYSHPNA
ncbi:hypothetical protein [Paracoccus methylarcula]|uniref:Lipoprotein n=1 Tax=Paracoccus methylarcula TaxID=72022 RepID=A0A3R7LIC8_9RHOB|nr:hypothetical protein [Paracoccus methylarcula]RNF35000.1 hypothetical protein A7A09_008440 [Paracoccus methylarcula]